MTTYLIVFAVLAVAVLALAGWRQMLDLHEDDTVHLADGEEGMIKDQVILAQKVKSVATAGKVLTVITVLYGLSLAGWVLYEQWVGSLKLP